MKENILILVVDDEKINIKLARKILEEEYIVAEAESGEEALEMISRKVPDLILLDVHMPGMDGHQVISKLKKSDKYKDIPVVFLTADDDAQAEITGFHEGAQDFIMKPLRKEILLARIRRIVELEFLKRNLQEEVRAQTEMAEARRKKVEQLSYQTVRTLATAIDAKDQYTNGHSTRVSEYSALIARELGWDNESVEDLRYVALLHDIGKIGVPDAILNKPGRLTDIEFQVIKSHTSMGAEILKNSTLIDYAEDVARHHHERFDGRGYPDRLSGGEISKAARIVAIADAFDAMSSKRIYRQALSNEVIRNELIKGRGAQFDPVPLDAFIKIWDDGRLIISEPYYNANICDDKDMVEASDMILAKVMETMNTQTRTDGMDFLTNLPIRSVGEKLISQSIMENRGAFVFLDLDNLKQINDTRGHTLGDEAIKILGGIIGSYDDMIACRLGGDEFIYFHPGAGYEFGKNRLEEIFQRYDDEKSKNISLKIASVSAGMVFCVPGCTFSEIYNKADKALYYAKQTGKASYYVYSDEKENTKTKSNTDISSLKKSIASSGSYEGALGVEYRQFAKLYEYISNIEKRYNHTFKLVLVTIEKSDGGSAYAEELEIAMTCMEQAIKESIRNVDIYTRYSGMQFLLILLDTEENGIRTVIDRIFQCYYKIYGGGRLSPMYTIEERPVEEVNN